jgi:hypothetical protein
MGEEAGIPYSCQTNRYYNNHNNVANYQSLNLGTFRSPPLLSGAACKGDGDPSISKQRQPRQIAAAAKAKP